MGSNLHHCAPILIIIMEMVEHLWIGDEESTPPEGLTEPTIGTDFCWHEPHVIFFCWMRKTWVKIEVIEYTHGYRFWQRAPLYRQLAILPEALPFSFSNMNKSTARETPKKPLTTQYYGSAAKTGLQIRVPVPPHLTAAVFILHDEFKDDTLETAVTVKSRRSFFFQARIHL